MAGTSGGDDTLFHNAYLKIAKGHAYEIQPFIDKNGQVMLKVVNPWSCSNQVILTIEQFKKYFRDVICIKKG